MTPLTPERLLDLSAEIHAALLAFADLLEQPGEASCSAPEVVERINTWEWCPICRGDLDTGLECLNCGADYMPISLHFKHPAPPRGGEPLTYEAFWAMVRATGLNPSPDELRALLIDKAAPEPSAWSPIATAPTIGKILLYWDVPHFDGKRGIISTGSYWADEDGEGWRNDGDQCVPRNQKDCTHWMPIPRGPSTKEESR